MTTVTQILNQARKYIGVAQGSATHKAIIDKYNSVKPLPVGYAVKYTDLLVYEIVQLKEEIKELKSILCR